MPLVKIQRAQLVSFKRAPTGMPLFIKSKFDSRQSA